MHRQVTGAGCKDCIAYTQGQVWLAAMLGVVDPGSLGVALAAAQTTPTRKFILTMAAWTARHKPR